MIKINKFRLYPNGFVFTDQVIKSLPSYYTSRNIVDKYKYYFDENSEVKYFEKDNFFVIIHGHHTYVNLDEEVIINLEEILLTKYRNNYNSFLDMLDYIGGRYVLIIGNVDKVEFYPDATNSRTAYYSEESILASSHINLLNDIKQHEIYELGQKAPLLTYHWNTTPYNKVKSISPNFKVDLISKKRERFFPRQENKYNKQSHENKLKIIDKLWRNQIDYYCNNYDNIIFSITGGADSRVSLAMVNGYLDDMKFFTYSTTEGEAHSSKYTSVLSNDQYIVRQILEDINLNHEFFFFDKNKYSLTQEQNEILNKNALKPHGRFLINFYLNSFPEFKVMHMRGTPLEVGRAYFLARERKNTVEEIKATFTHNMKRYEGDINIDEINTVFNDGVLNFDYDKNTYGYHLLDLYYWENRMGRWHSEILNENDVCFDTVMPFNMRAMIDISLSYTRKQRRSGYIFEELINKNYPLLNFYGKNDKKNLYENIRDNEEDSKELYFKELTVYEEDKAIDNIRSEDNKIFIPSKYFRENCKIQVDKKFNSSAGYLDIEFLNKYYNSKAVGYINFEIQVNDIEIVKDDIAQWKKETNYRIFNLKKDDTISFILRPLKNLQRTSWENASLSYLNIINETPTVTISPKAGTSNNPYTKIKV